MVVTKSMTLDELRTALVPATQLEYRVFEPSAGVAHLETRTIEDVEYPRLVLGNDVFRMEPSAYIELAHMMGCSKPYTESMPRSLMNEHVNYRMLNLSKIPRVGVNIGGNDTVYSVSRDDLTPVPNALILDAFEEYLGRDNCHFHHVDVGNEGAAFNVTAVEPHPVAVGDIVETGISVYNQTSGKPSLSLSYYVHRLACTNGAISSDHSYTQKKLAADDMRDWVRNSIQALFSYTPEELQRLRAMREVRLNRNHISTSLTSIIDEFGVPQSLRKEVRSRVMDTRPETLYDIYNIFTDVASNTEGVLGDSSLMRKMMRVGGSVATHQEFCDSCHRMIS